MKIKFYNTLGREKQLFKPLKDKIATIYSCGPTVYLYAHIGNMRAYISSDTLRRVLKHFGYQVKQVINITDVGHMTSDEDTGEDKIERAARQESKSPYELADFYEKAFWKDTDRLNIERPEFAPKATEYIPEMISLIKKLIDKGYAYITPSGIYYDVSKFKDYSKLALLDMSHREFGKRIEAHPDKKNPEDFSLWVLNQPHHIMQWDSPWGKGYPGWHIECSAMAMKLLGETIDIHTGGVDHIPVHHTNEIAQSEAATGKRFANFWLHNEFIKINGEKISKSKGNLILLDELVNKGFDPLAFRYFILSYHYRSVADFTYDKLEQAQKTLEKIRGLEESEISEADFAAYEAEIDQALADDLDFPRVLSLLHKANNRSLWNKYDSVLGLGLSKIIEIPSEIADLVSKREEARRNKNWEESDKIRSEIEDRGFVVKDTPEGTKVIKK